MSVATGLRADIHRYLDRTGMTYRQFGEHALGDPGFVGRLGSVGGIGPKREAKVRAFMADNPAGVGVSRSKAEGFAVVRRGEGYVDRNAVLPKPIGPVPAPAPSVIAEDHPALAPAIFAEAARRGTPVAALLSELVARGWAAMQGEAARHG